MVKKLGHLVLVVGPSGAGKDSIISGAKKHFAGDPGVIFPRRFVTRKADTAAEDHDSLTDMAFAIAVANGAFSLWWKAHNNAYGIPVSIESDLNAGRTVVFNCSRAVIAEAVGRFLKTTVVEITAPRDVLVERIVARGRESREEALARVSRSVSPYPRSATIVRIVNVGPLRESVDALCKVIAPSKHSGAHPDRRPLHQKNEGKNGNYGGRRLVVIK